MSTGVFFEEAMKKPEGSVVDVVYIVFSRTIDKRLHVRLVCKVTTHEIQGKLANWIQNLA